MIPKIIHYCWFGEKQIPKEFAGYIDGWQRLCPDYEIRKWSEDNFNVNECPYSHKAYFDKKYAFVSDYARFSILSQFGGIYLDTDVELLKNLDPLLMTSFMGFESPTGVAPGLIVGAEKDCCFIKECVEFYKNYDISKLDYTQTVVNITTDLLVKKGLLLEDTIQNIGDMTIYPIEYFNPLYTGKLKVTNNTYSIHHYAASWYSPFHRFLKKVRAFFRRHF